MDGPARFTVRLTPPGRSIGIDAARGIALFGMFATHLVDFIDDDLNISPSVWFAGHASALFAVLAGFSLVLSTGRTLAVPGSRAWADAALGTVVRGVLIALIGLLLGLISTHLAIILVNYGVMFILAAAILRARTWMLGLAAPLWMLLSPVLSMALRGGAGLESSYAVPDLINAWNVPWLLTEVLLTGYYPVLQWMGYVLFGMFLARLDWSRLSVMLSTGAACAGVALLADAVSSLLLTWKGRAVLEASLPPAQPFAPGSLDELLLTGTYGTTPTDTWWWLAVAAPHSGTPLDLLHTAGAAGAVIAGCVLLAHLLGPRRVLLSVLSVPGSMPLTIYSAHVILTEVTYAVGPVGWSALLLHMGVFIAFAFAWRLTIGPRGPLEGLLSRAVRAAQRLLPAR